jgi:CheY-like chemotaxis protein
MVDQSPLTLLLVEDDQVDAMAIQRGFTKSKIANTVVTASDGVDALEILRGQAPRKKLEKPFIILLDLNMPRMDGFEFLRVLRSDKELKNSVVFVLTTSKLDEDRMRAYDANVAGYIVKSEAGEGFVKAIQMLDHYWRIVELPS